MNRRKTLNLQHFLWVRRLFCFIPNLRKEERQWILIIFMAEGQINLLFIRWRIFNQDIRERKDNLLVEKAMIWYCWYMPTIPYKEADHDNR